VRACVYILLAYDQVEFSPIVNSGVPRIFFVVGGGWWCSTNSVEDRGQREWGSGGGSPLVRGSGGSCNLVQEIAFHTVKFSSFWYFRLFVMTNKFICHC
jgi:hypothetical protein